MTACDNLKLSFLNGECATVDLGVVNRLRLKRIYLEEESLRQNKGTPLLHLNKLDSQ